MQFCIVDGIVHTMNDQSSIFDNPRVILTALEYDKYIAPISENVDTQTPAPNTLTAIKDNSKIRPTANIYHTITLEYGTRTCSFLDFWNIPRSSTFNIKRTVPVRKQENTNTPVRSVKSKTFSAGDLDNEVTRLQHNFCSAVNWIAP